jgi:hypothetical protein
VGSAGSMAGRSTKMTRMITTAAATLMSTTESAGTADLYHAPWFVHRSWVLMIPWLLVSPSQLYRATAVIACWQKQVQRPRWQLVAFEVMPGPSWRSCYA